MTHTHLATQRHMHPWLPTSLVVFLLLLCTSAARAITYTRADSIKVVQLLKEGARQAKTASLPLFYARKFLGLPYVAHTLEVNDTEQLVVNLRQVDCTTLIDNVVALTHTTQHGSTSFADFCYWLQRLRYRNGQMTDYTSRNHYYSQAILSDERLGILHEIGPEPSNSHFPFTATQTIDLHYMSKHPDQYRMLKDAPQEQKDRIRQYEQEINGTVVRYIPTSLLNKGRKELSCIHDGDILALVTNKDGLDVSHLGMALWGSDGKLHFLNASSLHKKVVIEPTTLYEYMKKQSHRLGIRVLRVQGNS